MIEKEEPKEVKKMLICCGMLCAAFLLVCGTVMADFSMDNAYISNTTVTQGTSGSDTYFTVERTGLQNANEFYLLLIEKVSDDATTSSPVTPPTKENVYYVDVNSPTNGTIHFDAYPKDMDEGKYIFYLSDYGTGNGAVKGIASTQVGGGNIGTTRRLGDLSGDDQVDIEDLTTMINHIVNKKELTAEQWEVADIVVDGKVDIEDLTAVINNIVNKKEIVKRQGSGGN